MERQAVKVSMVSIVGNALLTVFKLLAGIIAHSGAMISDAVHSASDIFSSIIVIIGVKLAAKESDADHPYGHERFECVAAIVLAVILLVTGLFIGVGAVELILEPSTETVAIPGVLALVAAAVSIATKEGMYWYTRHHARKLDSGALMADAWHHRSDAFSSIGTAIGIGGAILLGERWRILDPIAAVVVSIFILKVAFDLAKSGLDELLEKSLPKATIEEIRRIILSVEGVSAPHHLRTRRIGSHYAIDVHIRMDGDLSLLRAHTIATEVERKIKATYGADTYINIHMEPVK
jgi:cation diffusion facilitator family transporter